MSHFGDDEQECNMEARVCEERQAAAQECTSLQDKVNNLSSQLHQAQLQVTTGTLHRYLQFYFYCYYY